MSKADNEPFTKVWGIYEWRPDAEGLLLVLPSHNRPFDNTYSEEFPFKDRMCTFRD